MEAQTITSSEKTIAVQIDGKEENISPYVLDILKSTNALIKEYGGFIELITFVRNYKMCRKLIESKKIYLKMLRTVFFIRYGIKA